MQDVCFKVQDPVQVSGAGESSGGHVEDDVLVDLMLANHIKWMCLAKNNVIPGFHTGFLAGVGGGRCCVHLATPIFLQPSLL